MDKGAHYYRCDFQVHSPRDRAWTGPDCVSEQERRDYAASLIRASRDKGLDAIAVTDHHDLLFARYIREAAGQENDPDGNPLPEERRIVVFPGIELTLAVPCQALLLFDAAFPSDLFSLVLTALAINPSKPSDAKTCETKRLDHITTLTALRTELDKHEYLRNRYIILPNVSEGGTDTLMRTGNAPKYVEMPCVGGYLDGSTDQIGRGNRNIFEGKTREWGHKRIAIFQTSDSRRSDHSNLGTHSTWVKWAIPTAEALRQACLGQESRISQTPPLIPSVVITGVSVSNSAFLGPINVELNPQYNALIGGRGTGKSTILEYLRWALCDQLPALTGAEEMPNYQLRRKNLIEETLRSLNASVQVSFLLNGIPHVVRRQSDTQDILLKVGEAEFRPCKEQDVRTLLPIQAYSQKQLSNVSVRLEELSRFVEAPVRAALDEVERQFEKAAADIRQTYATILRKRALEQQRANDELALTSAVEQADKLRKSLKGLSEADAKLLAEKPRYEQAGEVLSTMLADLEAASDAVDAFVGALDELPTQIEQDIKAMPQGSTLLAIQKAIAKTIKELQATGAGLVEIRNMVVSGGVAQGDLRKLESDWDTALAQFESRYEEAKRRATAHESQLKQLSDLEKRVAELRTAIAATRREVATLGEPDQRYAELRTTWTGLQRQRSEILKAECEKLTARSSGEIRATLRVGGGAVAFSEQLRAAVTGSGLRRDRIDAIGELLKDADDPLQALQDVLGELELLARIDPADDANKKMPECRRLAAAGFAMADLMKVAQRLTPEAWLSLSLARLEDRPQFEYRARENEYISFQRASAGQQATALLKALLNQPGPPLIIDQPEEDLDNPVMLEVVEQVWRAKRERQLIFSSHNANLVVNGDAELVVWCDYRVAGDHSGGHIRGSGAIDVPEISAAIKRVMEGGEAAFKLRRDKYGF